MEQVTTDIIIDRLTAWVESKTPISASTWVDAAAKLTLLLSEEHDKLFSLQQTIAKMKVEYLDDGKSSAEAKTRVEATDTYRYFLSQKAKIERIEEQVRLAKVQARLKDNEYGFQ